MLLSTKFAGFIIGGSFATGLGWILETGQRVAPSLIYPGPQVVSTNQVESASAASLFDLRLLESWATERGLLPAVLKKVYDALLRGGDPSGGVGR